MIFINAHICTQMPYYPRYRRRTGFARYRRRYGYRRRRYARRSTISGSVSSRSRVRVRVLAEQLCTLTIPAKGVKSNVASSVPFAHHYPSPSPVLSSAPPSPRRSIRHILGSLIRSSVMELSRRLQLRPLLARLIQTCLPFRL